MGLFVLQGFFNLSKPYNSLRKYYIDISMKQENSYVPFQDINTVLPTSPFGTSIDENLEWCFSYL
jgi:hypothetical protein